MKAQGGEAEYVTNGEHSPHPTPAPWGGADAWPQRGLPSVPIPFWARFSLATSPGRPMRHTEPQPDGGKEGAWRGGLCVPRAQCYFLNGFGFCRMLLVTLLNKKSRGREMKQTAQNCLK